MPGRWHRLSDSESARDSESESESLSPSAANALRHRDGSRRGPGLERLRRRVGDGARRPPGRRPPRPDPLPPLRWPAKPGALLCPGLGLSRIPGPPGRVIIIMIQCHESWPGRRITGTVTTRDSEPVMIHWPRARPAAHAAGPARGA